MTPLLRRWLWIALVALAVVASIYTTACTPLSERPFNPTVKQVVRPQIEGVDDIHNGMRCAKMCEIYDLLDRQGILGVPVCTNLYWSRARLSGMRCYPYPRNVRFK
jgi:hypothetical protein